MTHLEAYLAAGDFSQNFFSIFRIFTSYWSFCDLLSRCNEPFVQFASNYGTYVQGPCVYCKYLWNIFVVSPYLTKFLFNFWWKEYFLIFSPVSNKSQIIKFPLICLKCKNSEIVWYHRVLSRNFGKMASTHLERLERHIHAP